jgi:lipid-A-disaccharide synthase
VKLAVVAGEASGDLHASEVVRELKRLDPSLETFGIGGDLLAAEGTRLLHHAREMAIIGLFNVARHLPRFLRIYRELLARIEAEKPDAVLLVDFAEFNMRVAKACSELGIHVVYYISPQLWAWRQGRVRHVARYVDRMMVIFPFEEEFYKRHDVPVTYVGHPLVEQLGAIQRPPAQEGVLRIALLPGSRRSEVQHLLPPMLDAIAILRRERNIDAYVIQAPTIHREKLEGIMSERGVEVTIVPHDRGEGLAAADVALTSSGTAALESAVLGTPCVVVYHLSRLNYVMALLLVKLPHFSLINIVAGREVVPELIQQDVNGPRIADEVRKLVEPQRYAQVREDLAAVRAQLGEEGASRRVAEEITRLVAAS